MAMWPFSQSKVDAGVITPSSRARAITKALNVEPGSNASVTARHGLADDTVFQILDDGRGSFWLTSNHGVTRVSRSSLGAVLDGKAARLDVRVFGKADGLGSNQCNGATQPSGIRMANGQLAVPTLVPPVVPGGGGAHFRPRWGDIEFGG